MKYIQLYNSPTVYCKTGVDKLKKVVQGKNTFGNTNGSYLEGSDTQDRKDNVLGIWKREKVSSYSTFMYLIYVFHWFNSLSGPLCHLVRSLQTERYSAEDTLYQNLMPWWKPYPSTRAYTRTGL